MTEPGRPSTTQPVLESAHARGPGPRPTGAHHRVGLAEVLSALSHALDMTEGQPPGHTLRACMIGMRLASEMNLSDADREALYYALLLKDAGCSSNAARMATLFGTSDQEAKYRMKLADWQQAAQLAVHTLRTVGRGSALWTRAAHFLRIARTPDMTRELIAMRCERGAEIVRQIGFPEAAASAVRSLDEHWNGKGYPDGLAGEAIPTLSRIALIAQSVEIFASASGSPAALQMLRRRRGTWFDPQMVDRVLGWRSDAEWWRSLRSTDVTDRVIDGEPGPQARLVDGEGLDRIALAFAQIIDAKSPFTFRHSTNVAEYARAVAEVLGLDPAQCDRAYRAGLLHDIGKLGISNRILDKNGPLSPAERLEIERHPVYSWEILDRVPAFHEFARPAVLHHEKLDGTGYPWRVSAEHLDPAARILAVVDIYEALTADRPYRAGMPHGKAFGIVAAEAGSKLCALSVAALESHLG